MPRKKYGKKRSPFDESLWLDQDLAAAMARRQREVTQDAPRFEKWRFVWDYKVVLFAEEQHIWDNREEAHGLFRVSFKNGFHFVGSVCMLAINRDRAWMDGNTIASKSRFKSTQVLVKKIGTDECPVEETDGSLFLGSFIIRHPHNDMVAREEILGSILPLLGIPDVDIRIDTLGPSIQRYVRGENSVLDTAVRSKVHMKRLDRMLRNGELEQGYMTGSGIPGVVREVLSEDENLHKLVEDDRLFNPGKPNLSATQELAAREKGMLKVNALFHDQKAHMYFTDQELINLGYGHSILTCQPYLLIPRSGWLQYRIMSKHELDLGHSFIDGKTWNQLTAQDTIYKLGPCGDVLFVLDGESQDEHSIETINLLRTTSHATA